MVALGITLLTFGLLFVDKYLLWLIWADLPSIGWGINCFTHMFAHSDILHWGFNMGVFIMPALYLEWRFGWRQTLSLFLVSGLVAAFTVIHMSQIYHIPLLGASGAISGIVAAAGVSMNHNWVTKLCGILLISAMLTINLYAISRGFGGGVAYWAHIGGALAGLLLGPILQSKSKSVST